MDIWNKDIKILNDYKKICNRVRQKTREIDKLIKTNIHIYKKNPKHILEICQGQD